jgi:beta-lactamase class A
MLTHATMRPLLAASLSLGLLAGIPASAQDPEQRLAATIDRIEQDLDARVGLLIRDSGSDWSVSYRADERVPMNSTFKTM